jgi:DNA polymerase-3 subunit epsilon
MKITKPIVFMDLETSGTNIETDRIVQIACIKIDNDGNQIEKEILINPTIPIPKAASDVHGITDDMVKDAPKFVNVSKAVYSFFEGCDIAGFNSDSFDVPLLMMEFERVGMTFPDWDCVFVDVLKYERLLHSNKLTEVYKRYTGNELDNAHNAMNDVRATLAVLVHQVEGKGDITPLEIDNLCQGDRKRFDVSGKCYYDKEGEVRWSFGKNMNKLVKDDLGYVNWVLSNSFPSETKARLRELLN